MCALIFARRKSAKETGERSRVFPLRFSALHHPFELIGGMRKGVHACVRATEKKIRRSAFDPPRRDISKDEIDVDRPRGSSDDDGSFQQSLTESAFSNIGQYPGVRALRGIYR